MLTPLRFPIAHYLLRFLLLVLGSFFARQAAATHIVGGELDLQHQTGSTYRITLNLYFDALNGNPGALDQDLTISIFEKSTNRRLQNVVLVLSSTRLLPTLIRPALSPR